uniref:Phosphatase and actin regulator n=1 Tax=Neogobius melanostomus TaxID=47308 RepID=A0A8C6T901_9GOBI
MSLPVTLKAPAVFHERIRSLERARTGTFLKHKLCSRPERSELVRMHILQETQADSSLHAAQLRLKRARLADSLNEKISQRPGPMELVEKNILPVEPEDEESGKGRHVYVTRKMADLNFIYVQSQTLLSFYSEQLPVSTTQCIGS